MSKTPNSLSIQDQSKSPNYALRRTLFAGAALLAGYGAITGLKDIGQAAYNEVVTINKTPHFDDSETYVVKSGDTPWSIASGEGPAIANNPTALFNRENNIEAQMPKNQPSLEAGEVIKLPAGSENGTKN